jgi:hypothetical protein
MHEGYNMTDAKGHKALALTLLTPIDIEIEMKNSRSELLMIA